MNPVKDCPRLQRRPDLSSFATWAHETLNTRSTTSIPFSTQPYPISPKTSQRYSSAIPGPITNPKHRHPDNHLNIHTLRALQIFFSNATSCKDDGRISCCIISPSADRVWLGYTAALQHSHKSLPKASQRLRN